MWDAFEEYVERRTQDPNEFDDPVKYGDVKKIEDRLRACSKRITETPASSPGFVELCQMRLDLVAQKSVAMKEIAEKVILDVYAFT